MLTLPTKTLRTATCYHCRAPFRASTHAITLTCPHCYKRLSLEDLIIHGLHKAKAVETAGMLLIERKGWLRSPVIRIGDRVQCEGRIEGDIIADGPVTFGPRAYFSGDLVAPALHVAPGATITGGNFRITSHAPHEAVP